MKKDYSINTGDLFLCKKKVVMTPSGKVEYKKGCFYISEYHNCITNASGDSGHGWANLPHSKPEWTKHFVKVKPNQKGFEVIKKLN